MRQIELIPGITSSILGFGCASIQGAVDADTAKLAIHKALDLGINHFDLARSYGYGDAERFVGKLLAGRREQVRIATKFGIYANWKARLFRPLKPIYRALRGKKQQSSIAIPNNQQVATVARKYNPLHSRFEIISQNMLDSLDRSLRALQTDYVDYLFVHEPIEDIKNIELLIEMSNKLKRQGKIRGLGLATLEWNDTFAQNYAAHFDILQFARPSIESLPSMIESRKDNANVLYSLFRNSGGSSNLLQELSADLNKSVFVCSMFNPKHMEQNVAQVS